jgi:methyl-accepting chemotaxis protein
VKGLSEQTAKATEDIAQQIHSVQATTGMAAAAVRAIGTQVSDIHHLASSVAAAVEQQQAATADIARNVSIVANGSTQAAESARIVTQVAEHTGAEARRLSETSNQLAAVSAAVTKAVQEFIGAVSTNLDERRAALRQKVEKVLVVSAHGERQEAQTIDVSTTGMKVKNVRGMAPGRRWRSTPAPRLSRPGSSGARAPPAASNSTSRSE